MLITLFSLYNLNLVTPGTQCKICYDDIHTDILRTTALSRLFQYNVYK